MKTVTFKTLGNGYFKVFADGVETPYMIENMSAGRSGVSKNVYGIYTEGAKETKRIGTLAAAKKEVALWINPV